MSWKTLGDALGDLPGARGHLGKPLGTPWEALLGGSSMEGLGEASWSANMTGGFASALRPIISYP